MPRSSGVDNAAHSLRPAIRVLAVDDQQEILSALDRSLKSRGFDITGTTEARRGLALLEEELFDLVILDINMPDLSGLEFLPLARAAAPDTPVVVVTGDDRAKTAVDALRAGAFNYLVKPLDDIDAVALTLSRAANYCSLHRRAQELEGRVSAREQFETLVGSSAAMRKVFARIDKLGRSDVSVLLRGESGTGKELVARAIHQRSARNHGTFIGLNCGAMPEALIDSELFGHTRGAFTGAMQDRAGVFEEANGGTLFLDEIGDVPLPVQLRLLRVLEEREVRAVGATGARSVDVRVITATHVDLEDAVASKRFRADLFYRLNVVTVELPPLRERIEDVPLLAAHFLKKHAAVKGCPVPRLSRRAVSALSRYHWPGNVRELENTIQHAIALVGGDGDDEVELEDLPRTLQRIRVTQETPVVTVADATASDEMSWADELSFNEARKRSQQDFETAYLTRLLTRTQGNVSEAARIAGLDRSNFRRLLTRNGIRAEDHRDKAAPGPLETASLMH